MNTLNSIIIEGNMVRDPVLKETPKGTPVCTFSIASNRFYRQDNSKVQETSYFDVESWSKLAQACNNIGNKGRGVRVVGRLKQDRWKGTDGKNYSKIKVIAEHIEFKPVFQGKSANTQESAETTGEAIVNEHKAKKAESKKVPF
ncbi:MAG: single-stranded DNA-binding protein [Treponema sp.]|nr:MAG: single-stranded DNA-binding protein [Treponema sp.]